MGCNECFFLPWLSIGGFPSSSGGLCEIEKFPGVPKYQFQMINGCLVKQPFPMETTIYQWMSIRFQVNLTLKSSHLMVCKTSNSTGRSLILSVQNIWGLQKRFQSSKSKRMIPRTQKLLKRNNEDSNLFFADFVRFWIWCLVSRSLVWFWASQVASAGERVCLWWCFFFLPVSQMKSTHLQFIFKDFYHQVIAWDFKAWFQMQRSLFQRQFLSC